MKRIGKNSMWLIVLVLAGALVFAGYARYKKMTVRRDLSDFIRTVSLGDLKLDLQESGELVSRDSVDVFPPGKGFIVEVMRKEGEYVEKGEKLMMFKGGERIDSTQYVPVPIMAPRAGLMTRCVSRYGQGDEEIREGKRMDGASACVTRIVDMNTLAVNLKISEIDIFKLKRGMPVSVTFTAIPGEKFSGKIDVIAPMAEVKSGGWYSSGSSRVFRVVISIDKPSQKMRVGMSSVVTANMKAKKGVLKAPIETVFQEGLNYFVYRQKEDYEAEKLQVFPGMRSETEMELVGPVKDGDRLFTTLPETLK